MLLWKWLLFNIRAWRPIAPGSTKTIRLLCLKMPRSTFVEHVRRLLYLKLRKHFVENYFLDDLDLLITRGKWFLSSDNSGMIVVQRKRLFNHLFISITSTQRPFMTTRKQWNQLSANFKDAQSRLKNVNIRPSTKILNLALGNLLSVGSFNLLF